MGAASGPRLVAVILTQMSSASALAYSMSMSKYRLFSKHPVSTPLLLTGTIVVGRDIAHAKLKGMLDAGKPLPDYFKKTRNLDIKNSAVLLVSIYSVITVLSIFGGWVTGYLTKRGWTVTRARKTGMFIFACSVLPIFGVTSVGDWPAVFIIGLAGAAHQAWSANLFTTVSDMFPKHLVASVVGLGGMAGAVGGMIFQKFAGKLIDVFIAKPGWAPTGAVERALQKLTHLFQNPGATHAYVMLFAICGCAYLACFGIHHLLAPKFEPMKINNNTAA